MQAYLKKIEHYQVNNLILHLKQLKKNNNNNKKKIKVDSRKKNPKDQSKNKWKSNEGNNSKDQ